MGLLVTFGALALFFAAVVAILQRSHVADRSFDDFTVAGRSFGGFAQAMAFFNTYQPGTVFLGAFGFIVGNGVVGMGLSTLLAPIGMRGPCREPRRLSRLRCSDPSVRGREGEGRRSVRRCRERTQT